MGDRDRERDRDRRRRSRSRSRDRDSRRREERGGDRDRHHHSGGSRRRSRSRSRDRDRRDRREERRSPERKFSSEPPKPQQVDMAQINAMAQLQQQQLQQQLLAQQLLAAQQQAAAAGANAAQASKKQREVYVGNLTIGIVNDVMLRELFNGALASLVPDPQTNPPVVNCQLDPTGRFGFVELRSEELATSAMSLDKVELCGRSINVGRPKGYVEPMNGHARPAPVWMPGMPVPGAPAQAPVSTPMLPGPPAAASGPVPTCVLLLENLVPVKDLRDPAERQDLCDDVKEECNKDGRVVLGITCPVPPDSTLDSAGGRVYVKFAAPDQAKSAYALMNGRQFDGNTVKAQYLSDEQFTLAEGGSWLDHSQPAPASTLPGPPTLPGGGLPGPPAMPVSSGGMHPAIAALAKTNPTLAAQMMGALPHGGVPGQTPQ